MHADALGDLRPCRRGTLLQQQARLAWAPRHRLIHRCAFPSSASGQMQRSTVTSRCGQRPYPGSGPAESSTGIAVMDCSESTAHRSTHPSVHHPSHSPARRSPNPIARLPHSEGAGRRAVFSDSHGAGDTGSWSLRLPFTVRARLYTLRGPHPPAGLSPADGVTAALRQMGPGRNCHEKDVINVRFSPA
jgi:hypothetical protein